ncbi:omega3 desaturase [Gamsiella multidivaricata]|uniref:omega3 desaturase n=1 Tax=Gamsiella multidivaricata TaxID=101098 RepID=UPI002221250F|nr:omega3 desaturase [Gamsiella multidivaricata]KAG0366015.1 Acyl-lipid omega-3 desaturase [Gamsiella multidivaricata]KAI7823324.1 omega3 desaturase [Gamsiella multidivaricata]
MAPPNVIEESIRHRIVLQGEPQTKSNYEQGYMPMDFTIKEIRDAIPAHLFVRDTTKSIMHVAKDLITIAAVFYCATFIETLPSLALRIPAWIAYWIIQGTVMVGPWILAHECGHGAFSDNKTVNTIFGWTLHSALLVPYQAWQMSHSKHHKGTGSMTKDVVFIPATRSYLGLPPLEKKNQDDLSELDHHHDHEESIFAETPLYTLIVLVLILTFGWPLYLIKNMSGQEAPHWVNHFQTIAPLFEPHQAKNIFYSNCGIVAMVSILTYLSIVFSPLTVFMYYGIPYLGVNAWIVCITYLQHTDPMVPHFRDNVWNFQRGAACTVDRSFGKIVDHLHHHIGDSHQCHHMFSQMPFYNAVEATKHLKAKLGKYYLQDDTPIAKALYRNWRQCKFVEDEGEVVFYKH